MIKSCRWLKEIDWDMIMKGTIKMPYKVDLYESYIHKEFKNIVIKDNINL